MSHAMGEIIHDGKVVGYFEYDGTADVILPKIWATKDEVVEHWREGNSFDRECTCGKEPTAVQIYSDYGYGAWVDGIACLTCGVILGDLCWDQYETEHDGHPICAEGEKHAFGECGCEETGDQP